MKPSLRQENKLWRQGYGLIAGVDEVGRGAWAGPVVAAAVVFRRAAGKRRDWHRLVRDSKELSPTQREKLFTLATPEVDWSVSVISNQKIDKKGIAVANKLAVIKAVQGLAPRPDFVLSDYIPNIGGTIAGKPAQVVIDGDVSIFSIALASVIAKVWRDRLMAKYDKEYPGYGFARHKGYGTRQHAVCLASLGPCALHRRSYRPIKAGLL